MRFLEVMDLLRTFPKMKSLKNKLNFLPKNIFNILYNCSENSKFQRVLDYLSSKEDVDINTYLFLRSLFSDSEIKRFSLKTKKE